jgi:hypothetical protein
MQGLRTQTTILRITGVPERFELNTSISEIRTVIAALILSIEQLHEEP